MSELILPAGLSAVDTPMPGLRIDTPAAKGLIYFNGAHLAEWTPTGGRPVLWLSQHSTFETGKAIRGGVPLIWPWFGNGPAGDRQPGHGLARLATWHLQHASVSASGTVSLTLQLPTGELGREDLPDDALLELHISMGQALMVQFVAQAGASDLTCEAGLHSYFAVGDIDRVEVTGLDGASYFDKVTGENAVQSGPVRFVGETDRIYSSTGTTQIVDACWQRTIQVEKVGSAQTVVWNPWTAKAAAMPDFGDDEWPSMVCVEAVNCREHLVMVPAGTRALMSQTISVL